MTRDRQICLLLVSLLAAFTWAQTPTGSIEGIVSDPSGAVIPNAKVTIAQAATGRSIPLTTNSTGFYSARNLLPGVYSIKVESAGFAVKDIRDLVVNSGAVVNGNVTLEIGKTGEVVEIAAQAVAVDTSRQTLDNIISEKEIKQLPLFSRNFLDLASIAPGVFIRDGGSIDPTKTFAYRAVGIDGRSGTGTRVQMDGIDVTDETVGTTVANISQEAVNQFQLTRSSLDISTSLTSSGAVNIISNSGSNQLHGSWFYDYFNQDLGARLQYQPDASDFHRKRTGGSVGGPFVKDKVFWYANWERTWQATQDVQRHPEFPKFNVVQGFPTRLQYALGRLDWNATPGIRIFYKFQHSDDLSTGGTAISPFQNIDWTNVHTIGFDLTKARATNAFRFGYTNFNNQINSQELQTKFLVSNGVPVQLNVGPISWGPNGLAPQATYQDNYQLSYDGSYVWNRHTFRYGVSYTHIALGGFANFAGPLAVAGVYDDATLGSLKAAGLDVQDPLNFPLDSFSTGPSNGFFTLRAGHNLPHGDHLNNRTAWFVGDNIKATRRLTINLGLRYEYDSGYFNNDRNVHRDPILETWGKGFSQFPEPPKNLYSPSVGFAWDPTGSTKTSIRGGFYKAYEMNIFNNLIFDEFIQLPPGIGPDSYDFSSITGPDGTPINVDGKHPDGDYTDLAGQPIKSVLGLISQVHQALQTAYANYKFDPNKGQSDFRILKQDFDGIYPGKQFKAPYALQWNIGIQRELKPGTVLSVDYLYNHGVGLPFMFPDFERRRDASTLNVANATSKVNSVLKGQTVDQYIAANPKATIATFGLASDSIYQGLTSDFIRARFFQGGFTKYQALQANITGRVNRSGMFKDSTYTVSYSYGGSQASAAAGRAEFITNPLDNRVPNNSTTFGPTGLDFRHILTAGGLMNLPGKFVLNSFWTFRSAGAQTITVPNLGGAISSSNGIFGTDLNGDGGTGAGAPRGDVFPGVNAGQFGRDVSSLSQVNKLIQEFNSNYAGKLTPAGQALVSAGLFTQAQLVKLGAVVPTVPAIPAGGPNPWHSLFTANLRVTRPVVIKEHWRISPFADIINLFNHAPAGLYGGLTGVFGALNFDYANAVPGRQVSDLTFRRGRNADTRQVQIGVRLDF